VQTFYVFNEQVASESQVRKLINESQATSAFDLKKEQEEFQGLVDH